MVFYHICIHYIYIYTHDPFHIYTNIYIPGVSIRHHHRRKITPDRSFFMRKTWPDIYLIHIYWPYILHRQILTRMSSRFHFFNPLILTQWSALKTVPSMTRGNSYTLRHTARAERKKKRKNEIYTYIKAWWS